MKNQQQFYLFGQIQSGETGGQPYIDASPYKVRDYFLKMGQPRPLFRLFLVFSNKHYNFYNKYMWKNVHPVYGPGIRTHELWNMSLFP